MEQIKLTQTQVIFPDGSAASGFSDSLASAPAYIDERLIADEVLRVRRRHRKGVGWIVKGKGNASSNSLTFSSRSQSQAE